MKVSYFFHFILTLFVPLVLCGQAKSPVVGGVKKVVIDAGHGGKDPGTVYGNIREKDINLNVALKLGKMIGESHPDVEVIYTRKTDVFVELFERGDIANRANADLFISIHVNAAKNTAATGSSTFIMGLEKSEKNLDVAMSENDVISYEDDYTAKYEGYTPGSTESFIIFSLMQYAYQEQSMNFAEMIQKHYTKLTPLHDRGAWQGPYLVLWRTAMPSVLTEMGFMSNKSDREYLITDAGQTAIAQSLADAFTEYKAAREGSNHNMVNGTDVASGNSATKTPVEGKTQTAVAKSPASTADTQTGAVTGGKAGNVKYYVQIMTVSSKLASNSSSYKSYKNNVVQKKTPTGKYRCLVGGVGSFAEAETLLKKVRKEFKDAFIVAYRGDEYFNTAAARQLEN